MPNGQEIVTFSGMNQDVDPRFLPDGAYVSADNFRIGLIGEGTASVQSVEGNISLELDIPTSGITKCVGLFDSKVDSKLYTFIYNHRWITSGISIAFSASPTTITATAHGLSEYDKVTFQGVTGGATNYTLNNRSYIITNVTANTFDIDFDSSVPTLVMTNASIYTTNHQIIEYDYKNNKQSNVIRSHYLDFKIDSPIKKIDTNLDFLMWTDGESEPKTINRKRAVNGDYPKDGSGRIVWELDYITTAKLMPHYPMYCGAETDGVIDNSRIGQRAYQFRCRWIYKDGQKSAWSPMGLLVSGGDNFSTERNKINLRVPFRDNYSDSEQVITEVVYAEQSDLGNFNSGSWYMFDSFDRRTMSKTITSDGTPADRIPEFYYDNYITIEFTGGNGYLLISDEDDISALNDGVPRKANTQAIIETNRPVYGGITERFDMVDIDMASRVSFRDDTTYLDKANVPKAGCSHLLGIVYYDEFMRSQSVQTLTPDNESTTSYPVGYSGHLNPYVPFWGETRTLASGASTGDGIPEIDLQITNKPPDWAKYWNIVYGGNDKIGGFIQGNARSYDLYDYKGDVRTAISLKDIKDAYLEDNELHLDYTYEEGDRLRVKYTNSSTPTIATSYIDHEIDEYTVDLPLAEDGISVPVVASYPATRYPDIGTYVVGIATSALAPIPELETGDSILLRFQPSDNAVVLANLSNRIFTVVGTSNDNTYTLLAIDLTLATTLATWGASATGQSGQAFNNSKDTGIVINHEPLIAPTVATSATKEIGIEIYRDKPQVDIDTILWKETPLWGGVYQDSTFNSAHMTQFNNVSDGSTNQNGATVGTTIVEWNGQISDGASTNDNTRRTIGDCWYGRTSFKDGSGNKLSYESLYAIPTIKSQSFSIGRPNKVLQNFKEQYSGTKLVWGQPTLNLNAENGINKFYDLDAKELSLEYGDIISISDKDRAMVVFQESKIGYMPVNQYSVIEQSGAAIIGRTKDVFSDINYAGMDYGLSGGANSVDSFNGVYYITDPKNGVVCRYVINELGEMSMKGMNRFFKDTFSFTPSYNKIDEYSNYWDNNVTVDKNNEEVVFNLVNKTVLNAESEVALGQHKFYVNNNTTDFGDIPEGTIANVVILDLDGNAVMNYTGSIESFVPSGVSEFTIIGDDVPDTVTALTQLGLTSTTSIITFTAFEKTIAFSTVNETWTSFYSFLPESMEQVGYNYATAKDGQVWIHRPYVSRDADRNVSEFYGDLYNSKIKLSGNDNPISEKIWQVFGIQGRIQDQNNSLDRDIQASVTHTTQQGQLTSGNKEDFEFLEGYYYSNIYMDENTPNIGLAKYNGEPIRDSAIITEIEYDNTQQTTLGRRVVNIIAAVYKYANSFN